MTKRKRIIFIVLGFIIAAAALTHWLPYINIALNRADDYRNNAIENQVNFTLSAMADDEVKTYYKDYVNYDNWAAAYKFAVSESDFAAKTDSECLKLYNKIVKATHNPDRHSFYSTYGMKKGTAYESLIVDGVKYSIEHDLDIKANYFTFEPYNAKWSISITAEET